MNLFLLINTDLGWQERLLENESFRYVKLMYFLLLLLHSVPWLACWTLPFLLQAISNWSTRTSYGLRFSSYSLSYSCSFCFSCSVCFCYSYFRYWSAYSICRAETWRA